MERLYYMDTDSFIIHIKTKYAYEDIADDFEKIFDNSNYVLKDCYQKVIKRFDWINEI